VNENEAVARFITGKMILENSCQNRHDIPDLQEYHASQKGKA
jgi:hypothetical protein